MSASRLAMSAYAAPNFGCRLNMAEFPRAALAELAAPGDIVAAIPTARDGGCLHVRKAP
jgi:hypothetical protein